MIFLNNNNKKNFQVGNFKKSTDSFFQLFVHRALRRWESLESPKEARAAYDRASNNVFSEGTWWKVVSQLQGSYNTKIFRYSTANTIKVAK